MSTKYQTTNEVPTSILISRLQQLGDAIPKQNRDEFSMRIPAECDRDADLVIPEAAKRLDQLQATNKELLEALKNITKSCGSGFAQWDVEADGWNFPDWERGFDDAVTVIKQRAIEAITNAKQLDNQN